MKELYLPGSPLSRRGRAAMSSDERIREYPYRDAATDPDSLKAIARKAMISASEANEHSIRVAKEATFRMLQTQSVVSAPADIFTDRDGAIRIVWETEIEPSNWYALSRRGKPYIYFSTGREHRIAQDLSIADSAACWPGQMEGIKLPEMSSQLSRSRQIIHLRRVSNSEINVRPDKKGMCSSSQIGKDRDGHLRFLSENTTLRALHPAKYVEDREHRYVVNYRIGPRAGASRCCG